MEFDETNPLAIGSETATQESEAPVIETEEEDEGPVSLDAPEVEATPDEQAEEQTEPDDDPTADYSEIEIDGKRYRVPPELRDGYLRQADYTRKTQEAAEMRRQVEAEAATVREMRGITDEEVQAKGALFQIDTQLQQFANTNWQQLQNEDPIEANAQWMRFQQLKDARQQVLDYQGQLAQQRGQIAERETANRLKATADFAQKNIKGWSPDLDAKITEFAVTDLGYSLDTLKGAYNPQVYQTLYYAYLGKQTLTRQSAPKATAPAPTATVSAKASPTVNKDPSEMSMSEYAAWANAREKRRK